MDGAAFNPRNQTQQCFTPDTSTAQPSITPEVSPAPTPTHKSLTAERLEALFQMQKTEHFCKWISKCLSNVKHLNMKKNSSPTSENSYTNTSPIQVRYFLL